MRKTLAIVSYSIESVNSYYTQIKALFSGNILMQKITMNDIKNIKIINADVVLVPSYDMFGKIKKHISKETDIIFANRTISRSGLKKIMGIEKGSEVILIDESPEMTEQMISVIYQLGARHINIESYWTIKKEDIYKKPLIILGQSEYLPSYSKEIINIGNSLLDFNTIIDIGIKFDLMHMLNRQDISKSYNVEVETANFGLEEIFGLLNSRESQLEILLHTIDAGVIGIDSEGDIFLCNHDAEKIIGLKENDIINKNGLELFSRIPFKHALKKLEPIEEKLIKIHGEHVVVSVNPLVHSSKLYGAVAIMRRYDETEKKQHKIRKQLIGKGHVAKYYFDDIMGKSDVINKSKDIAKRMSKSNSSILITGETGTGKELFAQAIHNSSPRRNYPFVAVNCGAFPESLLESELFGYEEGAFTGARKGGKPGLFELAHNGTLFLDEIAEMPMNLQVKLLRVLQEKEVIRLGGDSLINVDFRLIAATNKNLKEMVNEGKFREDLYYRLNVLPLKIPPLRNRKEDILFLFEETKKQFNGDFILTEKAEELLLIHNWDGNVRELVNCVEYLVNLGSKIIDAEDLPFIEYENSINNKMDTKMQKNIVIEFLETAGDDLKKYIFVLEELKKAYISNKRLGRRSIHEIAKINGIFLSEQEVRRILIELEELEMVKINKGRAGTVITREGLNILGHITMG
ncbi:PAS domain S-box-containing protein [Keratinibaculum paraultunense]|uniref:PAS domain S-box-containing protein n=1 Tax=Keratinibaculum paraultunense TaxID=1278232 RepID=A0A4R3KZ42_9FIRM|nr:sigma 54-interacting transcriptional regulator [Keratinibaculum paraultunense]QQY80112.1 sigma 54-interacting transcriptional regulator [Keratinibaculum paraultunense]TCS91566.1 PAS domain S-box-containing protein [Keratinibaculum paraultunense]